MSRAKSHTVGIVFFALVTISALMAVIGIKAAAHAHAPTWAFLLFYSFLCLCVPIGGSIGYLFYVPSASETSSTVAPSDQRSDSVS